METHYVYIIENKVNGKSYVGQTKNLSERKRRHFSGSSCAKLLNSAVKKYGADKFYFSLIEKCLGQDEVNVREKYWIKYLRTLSPAGYNLSEGGGGISGYSFSSEQRQRLSIALKGIKRSEETCLKISLSKRGEKNPMHGCSGTSSPTYGHKHSEKTCYKMRESALGRNHSSQTKKKLSELSKGANNPMFDKKHSDETRRKMRARWAERKKRLSE
ncbi:hypothetical protein LCGC14_1885140 [marine sediment metagenome]|uniref:GIY-YIG domain-containing protein n=1 Tax=marine sediment metagenome TaxID=412755 RepID=A0A0F9G132_9ZZZZ